ncbi:MAG: DUF2252 domain-containing protein [Actinobacteria bacterium]|nr:DUF2252 domain-containing protein [Actinomycetota bacterium]
MDQEQADRFPASALAARDAARDERRERGEQLRKTVTRSSHGAWSEPEDRQSPVAILEAQNRSRLQELVPIRFGRMLASPFAFYRGAAAVMAADLAGTPTTAVEVQACGDAHLANFGLFASPERHLVFDLNDFDETVPGPWEWDVKRLAASAVLAARHRGLSDNTAHDAAVAVGAAYRDAMSLFASMNTLDVWYFHVDVDALMTEGAIDPITNQPRTPSRAAQRAARRAHEHDTLQAISKLTEVRDGRRRIRSDPPLLVPTPWGPELEPDRVFVNYRKSLPPDRRVLLDRFHFAEGARKVVGVGSVGARCWILLFDGGGADDPLLLQVKEANTSVLEPYWRPSGCSNHAERVVLGQRLMQAQSDIFLGWTRQEATRIDYYVRQLRDMKGGIDLDTIAAKELLAYANACGAVLARAHARAGDASLISGYLGASDRFDNALAAFSVAYADQTERDHARLERAAKKGRIPAERGV